MASKRLTDLIAGIDPVELQLMVLSVLERRGLDPEKRAEIIQGSRTRLIDLIDDAGGAQAILREAVKRLRA
jgi:hypothetical protein